MTHPSNDNDRDLRELFTKARRAERRRAPEFDSMLTRSDRSRPGSFPGRRLLAISFSTTMIASLAVLGAGWMLVPRFEPEPVRIVANTAQLVELHDPIEPQPAPANEILIASEPQPKPIDDNPTGPLASLGYVAPLSSPAPVPAESEPARDSQVAAQQEYERQRQASALSEEVIERVAVVARSPVVDLESTSTTTKFTDEYIQQLPVPGRFYQNLVTLAPGVQDADGDGNPNVHGSRTRDFKAEVGGVSNVAPLTGARESRLRSRSEPWNAEGYRSIEDNPFLSVTGNPLSTFSIDVDTASYSNVRRFLSTGTLPPPDAIRIEELINYFDYDYPSPAGGTPFSTDVEFAD